MNTASAVLRDIDELPGPRGMPVVGNLLQIELGRIHQILEKWAHEFGRYFRFELGGHHFLVVADHEVIGAVLRDRPDGFRRTVRLQNVAQEMGLGPGLFGAEGEAWRHQRRMVMAGFDPAHIRDYFPALMKVTHRLHGRWQKAARAGVAIGLQPDLMRFTVDAIAGLAFGADVNTLESDEDVIQRHLDKIFPALFKRGMSALPWWRFVRLPADRQLDRSVAAVNLAIDGFIAQARERMRIDPSLREHPRNLLEAMIAAADLGGSGVSDREVAGNVMTMLLAGEDTTANSLAWMICLLRRNPQTLQRAQDEVRRVAGDPAGYSLEQMGALQYVEACAHETMRLKPVAPVLILQALRDTVIADVRVPTDTVIWCLMRHDSLDERHFPDPAAFKPERWLGDGGPSQAANSAKRVSMPFGAGPRLCPGRNLALLEMKMAMAMLLGRFEIESVETPDGGDAQEHLSFTMAPLGLRMRLRELAA